MELIFRKLATQGVEGGAEGGTNATGSEMPLAAVRQEQL